MKTPPCEQKLADKLLTSDYQGIASIERRIASGERLLVLCTASWNSLYDAKLRNELGKIQLGELGATVTVLDADDKAAWAALRRWGVLNLPAVVVFAGATQVDTIIGCRPASELTSALTCLFTTPAQPN